MARNSPATAKRRAFAELLTFHVKNGTRPHATAGNPWSFAELARAVPSKRLDAARSDRSPAHWCRGTALPEDIEPILDALFGKAKQHEVARANLHAAFKEARAEKAGAKI